MNTVIHWRLAGFFLVTVLLLAFVPSTMISAEAATAVEKCFGKFKGRLPTGEELQKMLESHRQWLSLSHEDRIKESDLRANLCEANFNYAYKELNKADLREAILSRAYLPGASLNKAILSGADLSGANLSGAIQRGSFSSVKRLSSDPSGAGHPEQPFEYAVYPAGSGDVILGNLRT